MASKTFSGQLDQAMNEAAAEGNKILFIPQQTVGEVLPGAASELLVESDGTYSIKLAYNTYSIYHYSDVTKRKTLLATDIVVSTDTAVTTIPDLLGSVVPVTEDGVLTIQGYLDEANEAKTDAEAAQAATEALFDDFDSSVADSMALVHTETPSLSIPFNESGRLDYGVGTEYVSGLPVYGVDFTRSTSCYYINKSGLIDLVGVDEISIGKDGAYLHGSVAGNFTYNTQFNALGGWTLQSVTTSNTDGMSSPSVSGGEWDTYKVIPSSTSGFPNVRKQLSSGSTGDYTVRAIAKSGGYDYLGLVIYTEDTANYAVINLTDLSFSVKFTSSTQISTDKMSATKLSDGWVMFTVVCDFETTTTSSTQVRLVPLPDDSTFEFAGDGTSGVYIAWADVSGGNLLGGAPLTISTTSSASTITATNCTSPINGNLPAPGESFTIICDAAVPNRRCVVFSIVDSDFILQRFQEDDTVSFRISDGTTSVPSVVSTSTDGVMQRYVITYNSDTSTLTNYADGALSDSDSLSGIDWTLTPLNTGSNLSIGGPVDNYYLNSPIKNFKILPYAASADEVKAWGAPK